MEQTVDEFAAEARAFLEANAPRRQRSSAETVWGEGGDRFSIFGEPATDAAMSAARAWQRTRYENGFGWITGPRAFGGRDLSAAHEIAYHDVEADYDTPDMTTLRIVGTSLVGPTVYAYGTEEQKREFLPAIYRGDSVVCQLFSEPGAGSDLAGLRTRAERVGDGWVINGQKVWTSVAHRSDIGELLCRTDRDAPKHRGITAFIVDMNTPGIEVRPLREMTGGTEFNEVFFSDVHIPDSRRLGPVNEGWKVALTTLLTERSSAGADTSIAADPCLNTGHLLRLLRANGYGDDPAALRRLAEIHVQRAVTRSVNAQLLRKLRSGVTPGNESSVSKLMNTRDTTRALDFVGEIVGAAMVADTGEWGTYGWTELLLCTPALRLLGGTDEIMKNILAERVLGLPKEPRVPATTGGTR